MITIITVANNLDLYAKTIGNNPFMFLHQRHPSRSLSGQISSPTLPILPAQRKPVKPAVVALDPSK